MQAGVGERSLLTLDGAQIEQGVGDAARIVEFAEDPESVGDRFLGLCQPTLLDARGGEIVAGVGRAAPVADLGRTCSASS